jgi:hypothetical protein
MEVPADSCKAGTMGVVFLLLLVPDRQTVAIPVENLEAITAAIDEQEQVTGHRILGKGGRHQAQ